MSDIEVTIREMEIDGDPILAYYAGRLRESLRQVPDGWVLVPREEQDALLAVVRESTYGSDLGREGRAKVALQNYTDGMQVNDEELPGMWSHSDFMGGQTDCDPTPAQAGAMCDESSDDERVSAALCKAYEDGYKAALSAPAQAGAVALVEAFEDAVIRRMRAYNPEDPMPKDGGSIREELTARNALLAALGARAGAELPDLQRQIDQAHDNYMRGNIDATTRDWLIDKARRGGS